MTVESRFLVGSELADTDLPGLALQQDGTIDLIAPGGARSKLGAGGDTALRGWHAHWFNFGGWTVNSGVTGHWDTNDFEPTGIDFDTDGYADPGEAPFFSPVVPDELGGLYLLQLQARITPSAEGGFASAQLVGSTTVGKDWMPLLDPTLVTSGQLIQTVEFKDIAGGSNDADIGIVTNWSANAFSITRVDYWGIRVGPLP